MKSTKVGMTFRNIDKILMAGSKRSLDTGNVVLSEGILGYYQGVFFIGFICFVVSILGELSAYAEGGEQISGHWSVKGVEQLNEDIKGQRFDVAIEGAKSFIGIESKKDRSPYYAITTSDGTDSFIIQYPVAWRKSDDLMPQAPTNSEGPVFGFIYSGPFPTNQTTAAQLAWIAYALPNQTNIQISTQCTLPINCIVEDKLADVGTFIVEAQYSESNGLRALQSLKFYHPGSGPQKGTSLKYRSLYSGYNSGWLYAEYQVSRFTKVGQKLVPAQFSFEDYLPKQKGEPANRDDVDFFERWDFAADKADLAAAPPLEFPLEAANAKIIITDYRLQDQGGSPYGYQLHLNGEFMHRDSPKFSSIAHKFGADATAHTRSRYAFLPVFFLLVTIPFVLIWKARGKENKTNN